jgi:crotonobetainyl-CoA:carnitine CoA-transferase CaiB-like acyl-CoA transferase
MAGIGMLLADLGAEVIRIDRLAAADLIDRSIFSTAASGPSPST